MREESIKQKYAEALEYCRQEKFAEARDLANGLLAAPPSPLGELYAHAILVDADETPAQRLQNLIALQRLGQQQAWLAGRYKNLKAELFDELSAALDARQYEFVENTLDLIAEIAPNDATASLLRKLLQQSLAAHAQVEFHPIAVEAFEATAAENAHTFAAAPLAPPVASAEAVAALDENSIAPESAPPAVTDETQSFDLAEAASSHTESATPVAIVDEAQNSDALAPTSLQTESAAPIINIQEIQSSIQVEEANAPAENVTFTLAPQEIGEVYPPEEIYSAEELKNIREEYQREGLQQVLLAWFDQRIAQHGYWADYTESALVYEALGEMENAEALLLRLYYKQKAAPKAERWRKQTSWRLLNFYRRVGRRDLAARFYAAEKDSNLDASFLQELADFTHPLAHEVASTLEAMFEKEESPTANQAANETSAQESQAASAHATPASRAAILGCVGLFIDHENLWKSARTLNHIRWDAKATWDEARWFGGILQRLLEKARVEFARVAYRIAVGNWEDYGQTYFLQAYVRNKFIVLQPETVRESAPDKQKNGNYWDLKENSVDFKLADEIRRVQRQAERAGLPLRHVIIVSGDGDYAHVTNNLIEEDVRVQIWSVKYATNRIFRDLLGEENICFIDELCMEQQ